VASSAMRLHDAQGHRLYLTAGERDAFRQAADNSPRVVRTFCLTLFYTGCRISEALELTADRVDFRDQALTFPSRCPKPSWTSSTSSTASGRATRKAGCGAGPARPAITTSPPS
jgi:integrase